MGPKVVPLLLIVASAQALYDGREGKAIDFNNRPSLRQQFSLSDLTPEDNEVVYTQFTVKGLDVLDDLPPVNINHINSVHSNVKSVSSKNDVNKKTNRKQPMISSPRFPSRPQPSPAVPSFRRQDSNVHHPDRNNVYNFQPFPGLLNPWRNFYNFANFQPQVTTDRPRIEEERNKNKSDGKDLVRLTNTDRYYRYDITMTNKDRIRRRRPTTTPHTTPRPTTTTTTTTTERYQQEEYDYQYYDFNTNTVNREDYHQQDQDYMYGNEIYENSDYNEEPLYEDNSVNTLTGCPGTLRDCLSACSPVVSINPAAYKICVNECLDRC